jgi:glycosyltransferase involved in cell wall biosynthesis
MRAFGVRAPLRVIENGIELEPFLHPRRPRTKADYGLPDTALLLIFVGRLATEKNLLELLRQFALARGVLPQLRLAIIGKGAQEEELRRLVGELDQSDAVRFCGGVAYDEVPNWLAAADAFVTASTSEVHPLTIIEAMAAGKPIVAVDSPGVEDIVEPGVTGFLAGDAAALAATIGDLANDPARMQAIGAAARQAARRFDIRRTVAETVTLYEELLATRPDLERPHAHGRWSRRTEQWSDWLAQLAHWRPIERQRSRSMGDE